MKKRVVIIVAMVICLMLSACGADGGKKAEDSTKNVEGVKETAKDEPEEMQEEMQEEEPKEEEPKEEENQEEEIQEEENQEEIFNINEVAVLKDWEIIVTDAKIVDSIASDYGSFSPKEDGNKYIQVFVSIENKGKTADNFLPSFGMGDDVKAKVNYGDGYEFSSTNLLGYSNELHDSTVNPLSSKTGEIAFDIPDSVASAEDALIIQFISGNDAVEFKIR